MIMTVNGSIEKSLKESFLNPQRFLLAVSGGPDSQALLKAFPHVAKKLGHEVVVAVGVNHGIRPEADSELQLAEELSRSIGVTFETRRIQIEPGGNIQARARDGRYAALHDAANEWGAGQIVTAHHSDDRAETVLLRLLRASGAGSLAVLPSLSGRVFRPLLRVRRSALLAYCGVHGLQYATDPSNANERYTRVWLRQTVLPLLRERFPDVDDKLNLVADDMLRVVGVLNDLDQVSDPGSNGRGQKEVA
jgi:tRNA(Ile)-lysidine synthase